MARKSKEFGELLKPKKSSQRQEKFLERFKSNLERGTVGGEKIVISPPGEAKMSDVLTDFVAPYRTEVDTEVAYQRLLELAIMAWNTPSINLDKVGHPSLGLSVGVTSGWVHGCPTLSKVIGPPAITTVLISDHPCIERCPEPVVGLSVGGP